MEGKKKRMGCREMRESERLRGMSWSQGRERGKEIQHEEDEMEKNRKRNEINDCNCLITTFRHVIPVSVLFLFGRLFFQMHS